MCLNLIPGNLISGKSSLRYATKDIVCYKVLRIQKRKIHVLSDDSLIPIETLHAPYYIEFEYELNKKYNTELKPNGIYVRNKNVSNVWYTNLDCKFAEAITQYYNRTEIFRYVTYGFHTLNSLRDALHLKKDLEDDHFHRIYRIFECVIPKGSWYYVGVDDLHNDGFTSDSLIIKNQIECV